MPPSSPRTWPLAACLTLLASIAAGQEPAAEPPGLPATPEDAGAVVMSLAAGPDGTVWVGSEDRGILRFTPSADGGGGTWRRFSLPHGLGDPNAYALAVDPKGRVWAGSQSHGVAVFDGKSWRTYGPAEGPLGARVFDLAVQPRTGDVWMATDAGLTRYSQAGDSWTSWAPALKAAEGLPSRQIFALAFHPDGRLFAGTACHGVAVASPDDGYTAWEMSDPPDRPHVELYPTGLGLPTDQINDVLVHSTGVVFAATTRGLAGRDPDGSWHYVRGRDYAAKREGLHAPPKVRPPRTGGVPDSYMPKDYVTCLVEDDAGRLWAGVRGRGLMVFDPATGERVEVPGGKDTELPENFVTSILPRPGGTAYVGTWGGGVVRLDLSDRLPEATLSRESEDAAPVEIAPHPTPAPPPSEEELRDLLAGYLARRTPEADWPEVWGCHLGGDWQTKGDWVGRYGREKAILCAASSPMDHTFGHADGYRIEAGLGPEAREGDTRRLWLHELHWDDPRVLYDPLVGLRRQSSWNNSGHSYPIHHEGPDLWVGVDVPAGLHRLTGYFFNKDGHRAHNRTRDYLIELRTPYYKAWEVDGDMPNRLPEEIFEKTDVLASARVKHFWGGVHQRFAVRGPGRYLLRLCRNDSFNVEVNGLFLDRLSGGPDGGESTPGYLGKADFSPPEPPDGFESGGAVAVAAALAEATAERPSPATLPEVRRLRLLALRAAAAAEPGSGGVDAKAAAELAEHLRWHIPHWTLRDREAWEAQVLEAWQTGYGRSSDRPVPPARPADPQG